MDLGRYPAEKSEDTSSLVHLMYNKFINVFTNPTNTQLVFDEWNVYTTYR